MKVLYSLGAGFGGTGIGRTAENCIKKVVENHSVTIASYGIDKGAKDGFTHVNIKKPLRRPFSEKKKYRLKRAKKFDRKVCELIDKDIDIFHSWNGHCLESLKKARDVGATTILTRASSHMLTQIELIQEEFKRYGINRQVELREMIDRCVHEYKHADYIQVPSEFVKQSFVARGFTESRLLTVPFGVDFKKFHDAEVTGDIFKILFVGRISFRKGCQYLLEAFKKLDLKDAELVFLGNIEPTFRNFIARYRNMRGLNLPGFIRDPYALFASASVFAFPTIEEGSALVTYEAMASGLPVVTTFNSGSLVRDEVDGFIVPIRDVNSICEKLSFLYENRDIAREMGSNAREYIGAYSWNRFADKIAEYYGIIEEERSASRN